MSTEPSGGRRLPYSTYRGFAGGSDSKESACNAGNLGLIPGSGTFPEALHSNMLAWRIPWTEEPGKAPWGHKELDTTERLTLLFSTCEVIVSQTKGKNPADMVMTAEQTDVIPSKLCPILSGNLIVL